VADRSVFKTRHYVCVACRTSRSELAWNYDTFQCCGADMAETYDARGEAAAVHGDEIDEVIHHGICHDDGTPRRFRSKTDKYRALAAKNLCIDGETPKSSGARWV
jgi:hypothetical protein